MATRAKTRTAVKRGAVKQRGTGKRRARARGRPFPKGISGNPKGRPAVGKSLAEVIRRVGDEIDERKRMTRIEISVRALFTAAGRKNMVGVKAAQLLFERGWGKPPQTIEFDWHGEAQDIGLEPDELKAAVVSVLKQMVAARESSDEA